MATTLRYDAETAARLVAIHLTPDMVAQRAAVLRALVPNAGDRVLDAGSGPGLLAAAIAERVGAAGRVLGVDISEPLLAYARMHFATLPSLRFVRADAARLPCADASFDTIVCTQVLECLTDVDATLVEFARVLRPGGQLLAIDTDWDSVVWASGDAARMARVLALWDQHVADPHLPRTLGRRMERAGFERVCVRVVPLLNPAFDLDTYSNRLIDLIASFAASRGADASEIDAWARELRTRDDYFFSLNRYLFFATRAHPR
jgi:ubiquinone/menaquinone biosynthesis C-methylase UbiE